MIVVHNGFDGLEVAFRTQVPHKLAEKLDDAKTYAAENRHKAFLEWNGIRLEVEETGARGGYAFRCDTGLFGATWFFKKPNPSDPWGVRVSVKSLPLAVRGLGRVRADIYVTLGKLGFIIMDGAESISRVDYAVDVLVPEFVLDEDHFVMHARCNRKKHDEITEIRANGHSSRTTSVTIGKNPGRQVIVYDKREEVLVKNKAAAWKAIWSASLEGKGFAVPNFEDPAQSSIWRVELRAYKKHLKEGWGITSWQEFDDKVGDLFARALDEIKHTVPGGDSNRSRWQTSPLWDLVRSIVNEDIFEMRCFADPGRIREVIAEEQKRMLLGQSLGLLVSVAALDSIDAESFGEYVKDASQRILDLSNRHKVPIETRLAKAAERYRPIGQA